MTHFNNVHVLCSLLRTCDHQVSGEDALCVPTLSMAGLVALARPCSISGAVKVDTSSDRPQFLKAKVPVADSSKEVGLMMLDILL